MSSDNRVKKGSFFKALVSFRAKGMVLGSVELIPKNSHIMVLRGGSRIHFLASNGKNIYDAILDVDKFLENTVESVGLESLVDELKPYSLLKIKKNENGGFTCKMLENDTIIGDVSCESGSEHAVPKIEFEPLASCSHLLLQKIMIANKNKKYSLKKFIYYLYLNYQGFITFDEFCDNN